MKLHVAGTPIPQPPLLRLGAICALGSSVVIVRGRNKLLASVEGRDANGRPWRATERASYLCPLA